MRNKFSRSIIRLQLDALPRRHLVLVKFQPEQRVIEDCADAIVCFQLFSEIDLQTIVTTTKINTHNHTLALHCQYYGRINNSSDSQCKSVLNEKINK